MATREAHTIFDSFSQQDPRALQNFSWEIRGPEESVKERQRVGVFAAAAEKAVGGMRSMESAYARTSARRSPSELASDSVAAKICGAACVTSLSTRVTKVKQGTADS